MNTEYLAWCEHGVLMDEHGVLRMGEYRVLKMCENGVIRMDEHGALMNGKLVGRME